MNPKESLVKPRLWDMYFLSVNKKIEVLTNAIKFYLGDKKDLKIIDIGCGAKPYFPLFEKFALEYIGIDVKKTEFVDVVASAEDIPFSDNYFDVALSTQVLEHVKDYQEAINEMFRILKPNGIVFLATHGVWEIHGSPYDYWRFTNYGLKETFKQFREVKIINNGGAILCFFQICNIYFLKLINIPIIGLIIRGIILVNNLLGWYLDKLLGKYDFFVINYLVVAKK
ncbi:MAG: class I SAM-dependent methyltransferase [Minisyncoccales bacterium]